MNFILIEDEIQLKKNSLINMESYLSNLETKVSKLPGQSIIDRETTHILLSFCTLCTNLNGKKMSFQNVFIAMLENEEMRVLLKEMLCIDTDYEIVRLFIDHDPLITTSKYVTKYLNKNPRVL